MFGNMINSKAVMFSNNSELLYVVKIKVRSSRGFLHSDSRMKLYMRCKISKHRIMHTKGKQKHLQNLVIVIISNLGIQKEASSKYGQVSGKV